MKLKYKVPVASHRGLNLAEIHTAAGESQVKPEIIEHAHFVHNRNCSDSRLDWQKLPGL